MLYLFLKRLFDILMSIFVLIFLSPILILISLLIFFQDRKSVIFKQKRFGLNGGKFTFYKFRSMPVLTPNVTSDMKSKIKITPFGKILRRTNMDELPQFFNILKGDMSVIGPRPAILSQKNLIFLRKTNGSINIKPGLTGWAQVNSYDDMTESSKAQYDGEYFKDMSIGLDLLIIFKTIIYFTKKPPTY
jgi:O-antigen biosynthesis protein WbqP